MYNIPKNYVGIDISKDFLEVYIYPAGKGLTLENTESGIKKLLVAISNYTIEQIVCESSGGYENLMIHILQDANYNVWQADPKQIKAFIASQGVRAKTDKIDAKMMAIFSSQYKPKYSKNIAHQKNSKLRALIKRKTDLTELISIEKKRLKHPAQTYCKDAIYAHIEFMEQQLAKITEEINQSLKNDDEWIKKAQLMKSMPGIGDATCALLIAEMPELGTLTDKQVTALLGVAPYTQESGTIRGRACIEGGRIRVRNAVYMAALTATRWNPKFKKIYDRLKNAGKKSKVALVAIMRRIIITLNIMLKRQESWNYSMAE